MKYLISLLIFFGCITNNEPEKEIPPHKTYLPSEKSQLIIMDDYDIIWMCTGSIKVVDYGGHGTFYCEESEEW